MTTTPAHSLSISVTIDETLTLACNDCIFRRELDSSALVHDLARIQVEHHIETTAQTDRGTTPTAADTTPDEHSAPSCGCRPGRPCYGSKR